MPKFNADKKVYEPIELVLEGKTYSVTSVDQSIFDKINEVSKESKGKEDVGVLSRQLGAVLGVKASEFKNVDLRKMSAAIKFLTDTIVSQLEGKEGNA